MKRLSILVSVNHCAPDMGSEHGVGWNFISYLSRYHNLHVICRKHEYIDRLIAFERSALGEERNIRFYFVEQKVAYKGITRYFPLNYYRDYQQWQKKVYRLACEIMAQVPIDLIHQVTNITFREPGYLWRLNKPFVWGPVVVLGNDPVRFLPMYGRTELIKMILRRVTCQWQLRFNRRLREAVCSSRACLPVSRSVQSVLSTLGHSSFVIMPETGSTLTSDSVVEVSRRVEGESLKLLWVGRFDYSKGIMFLLRALCLLKSNVRYELTLVGDGIQRKQAVEFCEKHRICYHYKGYVPHREMEEIYKQSHLFFITSMMDATTTVLFESLQAGCPVACLDHLSFSEVIDSTCGLKVSVTTPEQIALDFARAIQTVYQDEPWRQTLAQGAVERARRHSWENKIEQLNALYRDILSQERENKIDFV